MYHPQLGRFISRDPIGYGARDENLYRYCGDAPLINSDPDGLKRSCALVTPPVILNRRTSSHWASAAGVLVDVSFSPGTVVNAEATIVKCKARIRANVKYNCTDTYSVPSYHCWGLLLRYTTKTITYRTWITISKPLEWWEPVPKIKRFNVKGSSLGFGPARAPGMKISWMAIPPASQKLANGVCINGRPPQWTPPATYTY
jgi:hypothetical protein